MATGPVTYHEPSLAALLTLLSFLYLLQIARNAVDWLVGAGLLGEIGLGIVYGPVAKILALEWEQTFIAIGYIGLILIVFEGGLELQPKLFLESLVISIPAALLGILLPLAFTFALFSAPSFGFPTIQAFTVGSALASTSLGTTFFILRSSESAGNLSQTRIGTILTGAALIDDIIALVLLSVITSLGESNGNSQGLGWIIGRPIVASISMAILTPIIVILFVKPVWTRFLEKRVENFGRNGELFIAVTLLSAFLAIAYSTGTTPLLGAFLAGSTLVLITSGESSINFGDTYHAYIHPLQKYIFAPLFFASIGITIPFLDLWTGKIIWRGIVFSILMTLGKFSVGILIIAMDAIKLNKKTRVETDGKFDLNSLLNESLPAGAFLGTALVARGEIGVLVLQVAYNSGPNGPGTSSVLSEEPYLIALWAVALCTIIGPIGFSLITKKFGGEIIRGKWGLPEKAVGADSA